MTRKCSHCGHNGHNSRTCPDRGVRLFGVRLTEGMRKSVSMGNLSHYSNHSATSEHSDSGAAGDGYLSDGLVQTSSNARERKKGVPWTEEEHRCFLLGLQKLGKGDWRGISKNFVTSRTPTQVASHAQKYFIRQSNLSKRKRRSSLFDISPEPEIGFECFSKAVDVTAPLHQLSLGQGSGNSTQFNDQRGMQGMAIPIPVQHFPASAPLCLSGMPLGSVKEDEANGGCGTAAEETAAPSVGTSTFLQAVPVRFPVPVWIGLGPSLFERPPGSSPCNIVKPTATLPTAPVRIDNELPQLRLGISPLPVEPSPLSLKLDEPSSRHSAFHPKASFSDNLRDGKRLNVPISVV